MVGLDDVVELLHLPEFGLGGTLAGLLRLPDGLAVASRLAGVDNDGPLLAPAQRLAQEPLGGIGIAGLRQEEVDGVATAVDRALQIRPFPSDLDAGLVHAPGPGKTARPVLPAQPLFSLGRAGLNPSAGRGVVRDCAALLRHFCKIAAAGPASAMPPHGPQDDLVPEMSPFEIAGHGRASKSAACQRLPSAAASLTRTAGSGSCNRALLLRAGT